MGPFGKNKLGVLRLTDLVLGIWPRKHRVSQLSTLMVHSLNVSGVFMVIARIALAFLGAVRRLSGDNMRG